MSTSEENSMQDVLDQLTAGCKVPAELFEIFNEEAEDHLRVIYDGLDQLSSDPSETEALANVRRSAHTLKGAAGAVGLNAATRISHRMEDLLDLLVERKQGPDSNQLHLFLRTTDVLQDLTAGDFETQATAERIFGLYEEYSRQLKLMGHTSEAPAAKPEVKPEVVPEVKPEANSNTQSSATAVDHDEPVEERRTIARAEDQNRFLRVPTQRLDDLVGVVGEMIINRSVMVQSIDQLESRIEQILEIIQRTRSTSFNLQDSVEKDTAATPSSEGTNQHGRTDLDSLEFDRYTDFQLLVQVISEGNSDVELVTNELQSLRSNLENLFRRQDQLNRDAQNSLMQIRMVPLGSIVSRLQRTVRTVAGKLGKSVELVVSGDHTELDKTVLDEIVDPLQHLLRNSLDHGIESADERLAAGKPGQSKIRLEAINQGTQVTLRISDDGRGIDVERVRQKAIQNGLIQEEDELSREELYRLIFLPGFSTAATLTDVSGRGVGMDVVRNAICSLNGSVRVYSEPGVGTTFTIQLPTSVGVAQALFVESANRVFAVPMQSVAKIMRLDLEAVRRDKSNTLQVNVDQHWLELRDLAGHLNLHDPNSVPGPKVVPSLLIIQVGDDEVALLVESVIGGQDVVVKNLGSHLGQVPGLIGATVRGDGSIVPILDPVDLVGKATTFAPRPAELLANESKAPRVSTAMVIDDSISVRRVTTNLLQNAGWDVVAACDGVDALNKLENMENLPDVFLCDMEMPRMDGIELIKRLRKQPEFTTVPIVMLTSRGGQKHRNMAFDAGVTDYLVKPFHEEQLLELVDELVQADWETVDA